MTCRPPSTVNKNFSEMMQDRNRIPAANIKKILTQLLQGVSVLLLKGEFHDGTNSLTDLRVHRFWDICAEPNTQHTADERAHSLCAI